MNIRVELAIRDRKCKNCGDLIISKSPCVHIEATDIASRRITGNICYTCLHELIDKCKELVKPANS